MSAAPDSRGPCPSQMASAHTHTPMLQGSTPSCSQEQPNSSIALHLLLLVYSFRCGLPTLHMPVGVIKSHMEISFSTLGLAVSMSVPWAWQTQVCQWLHRMESNHPLPQLPSAPAPMQKVKGQTRSNLHAHLSKHWTSSNECSWECETPAKLLGCVHNKHIMPHTFCHAA